MLNMRMHQTDPAAYAAAMEWLSTFEDFSEDSTDDSDLCDPDNGVCRVPQNPHVSEYWRKYSNTHASMYRKFCYPITPATRRYRVREVTSRR